MIENYDEINHFIYNKIDKYNEKFDEFKKTLDLQDDKIKKECSKALKKNIKKNPKKAAQKFINLAQDNTDTTETTEFEENETKKIFKGGMKDDDNFDDGEIDIEEESEEKEILNNNYKPLFIGIIIFWCLYIFTFSILYIVGADNFYNNIMFTPLLFIVNSYKSIINN